MKKLINIQSYLLSVSGLMLGAYAVFDTQGLLGAVALAQSLALAGLFVWSRQLLRRERKLKKQVNSREKQNINKRIIPEQGSVSQNLFRYVAQHNKELEDKLSDKLLNRDERHAHQLFQSLLASIQGQFDHKKEIDRLKLRVLELEASRAGQQPEHDDRKADEDRFSEL